MSPPIEIVAAVIRDNDGRTLLVRKQGTQAFMQPGGKREPGEDDLAALARELDEELGLTIIAGSVRPLGTFRARAANESGREVVAAVYEVAVDWRRRAACRNRRASVVRSARSAVRPCCAADAGPHPALTLNRPLR